MATWETLSGKLSEHGVYHESGDSVEALERLFREKGIAIPEDHKKRVDEVKTSQTGINAEIVLTGDAPKANDSLQQAVLNKIMGGEARDEEMEALKEEAKELGIKGFGNCKKETLIAKIEEAKEETKSE